jgi:hypothetical protein
MGDEVEVRRLDVYIYLSCFEIEIIDPDTCIVPFLVSEETLNA